MCSKRLIHFAWILCLCLFVSNGWCATPIFQLLNTYNTGGIEASSVAVADVNGDGKPDIIVADRCTSDPACSDGGIVGVLLGNGDGTFQPVRAYKSGGLYATWVTAHDMNGDGKPDLIVVNGSMGPSEAGGVGILFGNGDGTFQPAVTFASSGSPSTWAAVADFNHDGIPDIAIANFYDANWYYEGSISVLLGAGGGTFQPAQTMFGGYWANSVVAADVNGDGAADLLVGDEGYVRVLLGNGDGTFQAPAIYHSGGTEACWVAVADVNGDGKLDVIAANQFASSPNSGPASVGVLLGNGDGTFQPVTRYRTFNRGAGSIAIADLDRDNKLDILVTDEHLNIFWGLGDGTFHHAPPTKLPGGPITVADVDGDTRPDVIQASNDQVSVLRNIIPFATTTTLTSSLNPSVYGEAVTLTALVGSEGRFVPTGTVIFLSDGIAIGKAVIANGVAKLIEANLPAGNHQITAQYHGDSENAQSVSGPVTQIVGKAPTTTTITSSRNPSNQGQAVTFTARVTSNTVKVTGTVTFTAGGTTLGTVTLKSGKASVTTAALPSGSTEIIVTYDGTVNISGSSASLMQVVN